MSSIILQAEEQRGSRRGTIQAALQPPNVERPTSNTERRMRSAIGLRGGGYGFDYRSPQVFAGLFSYRFRTSSLGDTTWATSLRVPYFTSSAAIHGLAERSRL
jgi:hypothetical protein